MFSVTRFFAEKRTRNYRSRFVAKLFAFPFIYNSRDQNCAALSTPEAEYIAIYDTACQVKWIRTFLSELGFKMDQLLVIHRYNTCANVWAKISEDFKCANRMDIQTHFVRDTVQSGYVAVRM